VSINYDYITFNICHISPVLKFANLSKFEFEYLAISSAIRNERGSEIKLGDQKPNANQSDSNKFRIPRGESDLSQIRIISSWMWQGGDDCVRAAMQNIIITWCGGWEPKHIAPRSIRPQCDFGAARRPTSFFMVPVLCSRTPAYFYDPFVALAEAIRVHCTRDARLAECDINSAPVKTVCLRGGKLLIWEMRAPGFSSDTMTKPIHNP